MKNNKIQAVVCGMGAMGRQFVRLMVEKQVEIVGAIGRQTNIGQDIGELAGIPALGIKLQKDPEAVLGKVVADVAMLATESTLEQTYPMIKRCVEQKMNVISVSEEAFYPWQCASHLAAELDELAKAHGVTIYGTGVQDVFWSNLSVVLSGACHKITSISGENIALIDHMGKAVAQECYVGKSLSEFNSLKQTQTGGNPFTMALSSIAAELDLQTVGVIQEQKPILAKADVEAKPLGLTIRKGQIIGLANTTELITKEGIVLFGSIIGKLSEQGDQASNRWVIKGEPNLSIFTEDVHGDLTTCAISVNRIPDVINASPGFQTSVDLPKPKFRILPFHNYVIG